MLKIITNLSDRIAQAERGVLRLFALALPLMILANVAGRAMRSPIYWMDELSILIMVWLAMIAMSLTLKTRDAVAVTMLVDAVPPFLMKAMKILIDLLVLVFGITLLVLCHRWFDPMTLMRLGFDLREFSGQTFNFMYQDTTATLGVAKFWFWLVMPLVAVSISVHALSNLLQTMATPAEAALPCGVPAPAAGDRGAIQ
ncbi:TRAP transporter small permease [Hydrogenophaga sp.]|uniref:TRAP transporter small permease n=1 Tax=Hydrogenophaga sp. TaxID=1904254 RepID=UPI003F72BD69